MVLVAIARVVASAPDDPLGPVDQDPDKVRDTACKLVAPDRVCSPPKPQPPSQPPSLRLDWLSTFLWVLLIGGLLVVAYFLVRSLMSMDGGKGRRRKKERSEPEIDDLEDLAPVAVDRSREPVNWRAEAETHRRAGQIRDALRCRYRALVGDLARRGLIDEIPGRTTGEERAQLTDVAPRVASQFATAADLFDDAWYGNVAVDEADDDAFQRLEHAVLSTTSERAR